MLLFVICNDYSQWKDPSRSRCISSCLCYYCIL